MKIKVLLTKTVILITAFFMFATPLTVEAGLDNSTLVENIKERLPRNLPNDLILLSSEISKKETKSINEILTGKVDVCKVDEDVSSTVDSITSAAELLLAEKEKKEKEPILSDLSIDNGFILDEEAMERASNFEDIEEEDIYLLAAIIHCEARGESYDGQLAVGAVILNRVISEDFPDNIKEVIYQSGQFSPVSSGSLDRVLLNGDIDSSCISAAKDALYGVNPIGNCLYFRKKNGDTGTIIGNHIFK